MTRIKYCNKFFKTKDEAKSFIRERGYGAMYSNVKGSHSKREYRTEMLIMGYKPEGYYDEHPYCVAWNELHDELEEPEQDDEPYTPSCSAGDYGPSNPWDAPGMSVSDFI